MHPYFLEFLASTIFVFILFVSKGNSIAIAGTFGLLHHLIRNVSGGHINPVVTLAMTSSGKFPAKEFLPYAVSQFAGGLAAWELYKWT